MRTRAIVVLLLCFAAGACGSARGTSKTAQAGSAMPQNIIEPYLKIQTALAHDSVDGVNANAGTIATAASALGAPAATMNTAAQQLASASDLDAARSRFGTLSEAVVAYMDGQHLVAPNGVHVAICPMVQQPWLQEGAAIENPYYGSEMLNCGNFRAP